MGHFLILAWDCQCVHVRHGFEGQKQMFHPMFFHIFLPHCDFKKQTSSSDHSPLTGKRSNGTLKRNSSLLHCFECGSEHPGSCLKDEAAFLSGKKKISACSLFIWTIICRYEGTKGLEFSGSKQFLVIQLCRSVNSCRKRRCVTHLLSKTMDLLKSRQL